MLHALCQLFPCAFSYFYSMLGLIVASFDSIGASSAMLAESILIESTQPITQPWRESSELKAAQRCSHSDGSSFVCAFDAFVVLRSFFRFHPVDSFVSVSVFTGCGCACGGVNVSCASSTRGPARHRCDVIAVNCKHWI
jgi:hypothetical protein